MSRVTMYASAVALAFTLGACGGGSGGDGPGGGTDTGGSGGGGDNDHNVTAFLGLSRYDNYLATFSDGDATASLYVDDDGYMHVIVDTQQHQMTFLQRAGTDFVDTIRVDKHMFTYDPYNDAGKVTVTTPDGYFDYYYMDRSYAITGSDISSGVGGGSGNGPDGGGTSNGLCTYYQSGSAFEFIPGQQLGVCNPWPAQSANMCNDSALNELLDEDDKQVGTRISGAQYHSSGSCPGLGFPYPIGEGSYVDYDLLGNLGRSNSLAIPRLSAKKSLQSRYAPLELKALSCNAVSSQDAVAWRECTASLSKAYLEQIDSALNINWWKTIESEVLADYLGDTASAQLTSFAKAIQNAIDHPDYQQFSSSEDLPAATIDEYLALSTALKNALAKLLNDVSNDKVAEDYDVFGNSENILDNDGQPIANNDGMGGGQGGSGGGEEYSTICYYNHWTVGSDQEYESLSCYVKDEYGATFFSRSEGIRLIHPEKESQKSNVAIERRLTLHDKYTPNAVSSYSYFDKIDGYGNTLHLDKGAESKIDSDSQKDYHFYGVLYNSWPHTSEIIDRVIVVNNIHTEDSWLDRKERCGGVDNNFELRLKDQNGERTELFDLSQCPHPIDIDLAKAVHEYDDKSMWLYTGEYLQYLED